MKRARAEALKGTLWEANIVVKDTQLDVTFEIKNKEEKVYVGKVLEFDYFEKEWQYKVYYQADKRVEYYTDRELRTDELVRFINDEKAMDKYNGVDSSDDSD